VIETTRGHLMSVQWHLSDIRCIRFPYRRCHGKQRTNGRM